MKSGYLPTNTIRVFMPKANGLSRMYTLMSIEDQIVYQAYANVLAEGLVAIPQVRKRYKKSVFGNLYSNSVSQFFYQKWQDSYKAYTKAIIKAYESGKKYIASFDLTACYDSINHHLLRTVLTDKCRFSDNCANMFIQLLAQWESSCSLELAIGIPQGPQASGIVAEAILAEYDSYIEKIQKETSFLYFRYVDDIRILADNEPRTKGTTKVVPFVLGPGLPLVAAPFGHLNARREWIPPAAKTLIRRKNDARQKAGRAALSVRHHKSGISILSVPSTAAFFTPITQGGSLP